jgi:trans-2,3-dihydro-3-hydroxyanthranilate isomerase
MSRALRYLHLDVFTDTPFEGNQLAVFPDARGLDADEMQAIAREMAFSETTFVLPREDARTDVRMRIFTPGSELPMAGHPTIGSTYALAHEGTIAPEQPRFVFGLGVGPVPVDMTWREATLAFASMTQLPPDFGPPLADVSGIAEGLGVTSADITATGLPVQAVSCGVPFLLVPMTTRRAVDGAELNARALRAH